MSNLADRLVARLNLARNEYYNDDPSLPDVEFDKLENRLRKLAPNHKYFKQIGAKPKINKEKLPIQMGSLDKLRPGEVIDWCKEFDAKAEYVLMPKLDGIAGLLEYKNGKLIKIYRRGDGIIGQNVTHAGKHVQGVLPRITKKNNIYSAGNRCFIVGEFVIHNAIFKKHYDNKIVNGKAYRNQRNFCGGQLNSLKLDKAHISALKHMTFVSYGFRNPTAKPMDKYNELLILGFFGFTTILNPTRQIASPDGVTHKFKPLKNFYIFNSKDLVPNYLSTILSQWRKQIDILQDGLVLELNSHKLRSQIDKGELLPTYARAIKPEIEDQIAKEGALNNIEWSITDRNLRRPVIVLKQPLVFDGVRVSRISGSNARMVQKKKWGAGAILKVIRSGDVIPRITATLKPGKVELPTHCEVCKKKLQWTKTKTDLYCANSKCTAPQRRMLKRFFSTLFDRNKIGLAGGKIDKLVEAGYDTVPKILALTPKQISKIEGFAGKSSQNIVLGLDKALKKIKLSKIADASGCFTNETFGIGEKRLQLIFSKIKPAVILKGDTDKTLQLKLVKIKGIGPEIAELFVKQLPDFIKFYLQIEAQLTLAPEKKKASGRFTGQTATWTGFRDRDQEDYFTNNGGTVGSTVTQKTTVLFAASTTSTKARLAKAKGIKIIPQEKAWTFLKG